MLDEPTSGLDPEVTRSVRGMLDERRQAGCAVLVSTHNLDEAERLADRVGGTSDATARTRSPCRAASAADDRPRPRACRGRRAPRISIRHAASTARATIDGGALVLSLPQIDRDTPTFVRALVAAGADVLEIRPEVPALEDVYLHLMADEARTSAVPS